MPANYKIFKKSCKESLESLEKNIKGVEKQLQELIDSAEKVKQQYSIATSVKGIGPVTACHMAALSALQVEGELKAYYHRQLAQGKHKLWVINAVRNKLILRVCACIRANQLYDPQYMYQAA